MKSLIKLIILIVLCYLAIDTEFFEEVLFHQPSFDTGFYAGDYVIPILLSLILVSLTSGDKNEL